MKERIFTPKDNDGKSIFVFGSNLGGHHGAGAAREALENWGAVYGLGEGRQGMSYGISTQDRNIQTRSLESIEISVMTFIEYAKEHPELRFLVTKIGCGLAGLSEDQIAPMFAYAPENCILPDGWRK